ncbi:DMT family transporter [Aureivirga marina]|uniref:DMT family transporter n=1 Tax=Aureivirga marina TaxID=1182451 RepID=UPI0018CAF834|nr:EamA family transporter [Aureivirga marina]
MKSYLYFIAAATFWGLNFFFAKIMLKEVNFVEAGFWRYIFGVIALAILCIRSFPTLKEIRQNMMGTFLVGVIGLFGFNFFYFLSLVEGSAITAALILSLNPTFTLLFSFLIYKSKLFPKQIIGVVLSFIGVFYLILKGKFLNIENMEISMSDFYILLGSCFFAFHHIWVKKYSVDISNRTFTLLTAIMCLICYAVILPLFGIANLEVHSQSFWISSVGIGILGTAVAYFLWNQGIKIKGANQGAVFMNFIPISAAIFGEFFFHEKLHEYHLVSGLLIISGLIITNIKFKKFALKKVQND